MNKCYRCKEEIVVFGYCSDCRAKMAVERAMKRKNREISKYKVKSQAPENNRRKYLTPGTAMSTRPKNAIFIHGKNTVRHELSKSLGGIMLRKWGDIEFSLKLKNLLIEVDKEVHRTMKEYPKNPEDFISEAVPLENRKRIIDIVRTRDEQWFEWETQHDIEKEDSVTIYI